MEGYLSLPWFDVLKYSTLSGLQKFKRIQYSKKGKCDLHTCFSIRRCNCAFALIFRLYLNAFPSCVFIDFLIISVSSFLKFCSKWFSFDHIWYVRLHKVRFTVYSNLSKMVNRLGSVSILGLACGLMHTTLLTYIFSATIIKRTALCVYVLCSFVGRKVGRDEC